MLKRITLLLLLLIPTATMLAQKGSGYTIDKSAHDFGEIEAGNDRVADFVFTNTGSEDIFFLRADAPEECVLKYSDNSISPGLTAIVRVKYNPTRKGPFQRKIDLYISADEEPVELTLKGNVRFIEENQDMSCPDFNMPLAQKSLKQEVVVQVIDGESYKPISKAKIALKPDPSLLPLAATDLEGMTMVNVPIGLYDIEASAVGYSPDIKTFYIGKQTASVLIMLKPDKQQVTIVAAEPEPEQIEVIEPQQPEPPQPQPVEPEYVEKPGELAYSDYSPNNVVFLIDVSSSMGYPDKLPLLKDAMVTLLGSLRSIDRISIVTYATGTEVVMPSTTADKKDKIARKIEKLEAYGTTEGGKGIREAYRVAEENFIAGGNNQIIIATDGDFNLDNSDAALFRFIEKNADKVTLSVVGCGQKQRAIDKMKKIAESGKGSYIYISNEQEADAGLVDEIKLRSRRSAQVGSEQ